MANIEHPPGDSDIVIDDTSPQKAQVRIREEIERYGFFDPRKGATSVYYRGASSGERITVYCDEDDFSVMSDNNDFWFRSSLQQGTLHLDVRLVSPSEDGEVKRSGLLPHFAPLVDHSFSYFQEQGKSIDALYSGWGPHFAGIVNTNWTVFQEGLQNGLTQEEAALRTPTGKAAKKHGFTTVEVSIVDPNPEWDEEGGVDVYFRRST